jgi:N6-L-threonylcarbamoyladenine synthase
MDREIKLILSCESSCDETAFCVFDVNSNSVVRNVVRSQFVHEKFGGVVPELASQEHLRFINELCDVVSLNKEISLRDIDIFAATAGPGLPGSLVIGSSYTKALAWHFKKPFVPVNHLMGHVCSVSIENNVKYPHICLSVSGGHTAIYYVENELKYELIGGTVDDAAGECFDKISKLLGLGYPGGAKIEALAKENDYKDVFKFPRAKTKGLSFSFSGLKTAVLYKLVNDGFYNLEKKSLVKYIQSEYVRDVSSSLLCAISDMLVSKVAVSLNDFNNVAAISFVGGVSCNKYIRGKMKELARNKAIDFYVASPKHCIDNAAMIAQAALFLYKDNPSKFNNYSSDIFV